MLFRSIAVISLIALVCTRSLATETVVLTFVPRPDRVVNTETETIYLQSINLTGDDELVERNRARGVTFPLRLQSTGHQHIRSTTGPLANDGSFPLSLELLESSSQTVDQIGNSVPIKSPTADLVGMRVNALVSPSGSVEFVSLEGGDQKPELAKLIPQLLTSTFDSMKSLEGVALKVGESTQKSFVLDIPVPNIQTLRFSAVTTYKLLAVTGGTAKFSTSTTYVLQQPESSIQVEADGTGFGSMEYDVSRQVLQSADSEGSMKMSVRYGKGLVATTMHMRQSAVYTLQQ